jgi:hypothetical protein
VLLINNVEDFADPPTLGTVERAFKKIAHGTYVLTPYSKDTHGHFTHYYAAVWKPYLVKFMASLPPAPAGKAAQLTRGRKCRTGLRLGRSGRFSPLPASGGRGPASAGRRRASTCSSGF